MGSINPKGITTGRTATRAVALVGPAGTGKTTLAEAMLFSSGTINRQGSIEAGTTIGDSSPEARERGGSTEINLMHFDFLDDHFALIDMPGGAGFAADGLSALMAADIAVVVIDPAPERAVLVEPILRRLDEWHIPHVIFVNKIDNARIGAIRELIAELQPMSSAPLALRQIPIRDGEQVTGYVDLALERAYQYQQGSDSKPVNLPENIVEREQADRTRLLEMLADFDDSLLESLLNEEAPDSATIMGDLAEDTVSNRIVPVVFGSALNDSGVRRLLKLLRHETPRSDIAALRLNASDGALHVFKIANGGAMGRLALGRVLGTSLNEGDELIVGEESARAGSIFFVQGDKTAKRSSAEAGDIIAIAKVDAARSGSLLTKKGAAMLDAPQLDYPSRNASLSITTKERRDDVKLSAALHRLCEEDPALEWLHDDSSRETILRGINDEHLNVVLGRLQRRYGVPVESRPPSIAYRESIRKPASQRGRHKKQSGGHGQYGDVVLEIRPLERGAGFQFEERISGGVVPRQWFPAVEMGVRDAMMKGPLGFPVVDVAVSLVDGSYHSVDSSELAFRLAGRMAMLEAMTNAAPYLLEPVCRVVIDTPAGTGSKAGSVLSSRRGQILSMSPHPEWSRWDRVEATLPEAGLHGLDSELRSMSQGLASFTAEFDHLAEVTGKQADEVIKARAAMAD